MMTIVQNAMMQPAASRGAFPDGQLETPATPEGLRPNQGEAASPPRRVASIPRARAILAPSLGEAAQKALFSSMVSESRTKASKETLSDGELEAIARLAARDREVRAHEQAHARVGGPFAGQPSYTYQTGPDGKRYAIGGSVPIDLSPIPGDPEATVAKMRTVKAAALAPAEPSAADRRVAALAEAALREAEATMRAEARAETKTALEGGEASEESPTGITEARDAESPAEGNIERSTQGLISALAALDGRSEAQIGRRI
ncbi:MAG: putative metalloprotease CJM1_0395 family protein [Pseudomonadota bacterium]